MSAGALPCLRMRRERCSLSRSANGIVAQFAGPSFLRCFLQSTGQSCASCRFRAQCKALCRMVFDRQSAACSLWQSLRCCLKQPFGSLAKCQGSSLVPSLERPLRPVAGPADPEVSQGALPELPRRRVRLHRHRPGARPRPGLRSLRFVPGLLQETHAHLDVLLVTTGLCLLQRFNAGIHGVDGVDAETLQATGMWNAIIQRLGRPASNPSAALTVYLKCRSHDHRERLHSVVFRCGVARTKLTVCWCWGTSSGWRLHMW